MTCDIWAHIEDILSGLAFFIVIMTVIVGIGYLVTRG